MKGSCVVCVVKEFRQVCDILGFANGSYGKKKIITIGRIRVMIDFLVATLDLAPVLHASFTKHVRSPQSDRCELETLRPLFSSLRKETYWRKRGQNFLVKNKRKGNIMWKYYGKKKILLSRRKRKEEIILLLCFVQTFFSN